MLNLSLQRLKATKCPTDELSLTNRAIVNVGDFPDDVKWAQSASLPPSLSYAYLVLLLLRYADISPAAGQHFIFALEKTVEVPSGYVGFSLVQRKWAMLSINQELEVRPYRFDANSDVITSVSFETDFLQKKT